MALTTDDLAQIEALLTVPDADGDVLALVRRRFPGLSVTRCAASDVDAEPAFRASRRFDLHLVDGHDHCWQLTSDPARATGIVVVLHKVSA